MTSSDTAPPRMEEVACDFCGSGESTPVGQAVDWRYGYEGSFQIVQCQGCGLVYLNPRPAASELPKLYPEAYLSHSVVQDVNVDRSRLGFGRIVGAAKKRLSQVYFSTRRQDVGLETLAQAAILPTDLYARALGHIIYPDPPAAGGRALDVGCGSGRLLKVLKDLGWEVFGLEPSGAAADKARELVGSRIAVGSVPGSSFCRGTFDFIVASHVLEHTVSPAQVLREIHDMLKDGGCLLLVVPNYASTASRIFGTDWYHLDPPRHLFHFDPHTLRNYLSRSGFQIGRFAFLSEAWALERSMRRKYSFDESSGFKLGALKLATRVVSSFLSLWGNGEILVAYCKKAEA